MVGFVHVYHTPHTTYVLLPLGVANLKSTPYATYEIPRDTYQKSYHDFRIFLSHHAIFLSHQVRPKISKKIILIGNPY